MTKKETTVIAMKCFAIFILCQIFMMLPSVGSLAIKINHMGQRGPSNVWLYVVPCLSILSMIILAFLVWKFSNSVLTKETTADNSTDLGVNGVVKIILACMGVYFVVDAMIVLPYAIVNVQAANNAWDAINVTYLLAQVLELTFGALLIAKPGKWVKAIRSIGQI